MASKAQTGRGTTISTGTVPTIIGEIKTIKRSGNAWKTEDTSNLSTSTKSTEKITTILEAGSIEISGNRVSSDVGQIALETAYEEGTLTLFVITLPKTAAQTTTADTYTFSAYVISIAPADLDLTKSIQFSAKLDISGDCVFAAGA